MTHPNETDREQPKALELFEADLRAGFRFGRDELWAVLREAKAQQDELEALRAEVERLKRESRDGSSASLPRHFRNVPEL